jgi:hypothetical protein
MADPKRRRLRRWLGASRGSAEDPRDTRCRETVQEDAPFDHPFSSFLSSLKKRQSVPWAMIFCGFDLIIPISFSRRA